VAIGREVASEFADVGYFVRYDETCWQETFEDILDARKAGRRGRRGT
jgi:hypothetical protein